MAHQRITRFGGRVLHGDNTSLPPGAQYDLVCAFEVLEHIDDDAGALDQWLPLVKPGGHLLLSVPADPHRFGPSDVIAGHYRRYTAEQLGRRLIEAGAADLQITHYGWPLAYLLDMVRDKVAARRLAGASEVPEERSAGSGRFLQPTGQLAGQAIKVAVFPWALVQRLVPGRGPALVALASRPVDPAAQA